VARSRARYQAGAFLYHQAFAGRLPPLSCVLLLGLDILLRAFFGHIQHRLLTGAARWVWLPFSFLASFQVIETDLIRQVFQVVQALFCHCIPSHSLCCLMKSGTGGPVQTVLVLWTTAQLHRAFVFGRLGSLEATGAVIVLTTVWVPYLTPASTISRCSNRRGSE